jgi:hypothetical protein
MSSRSLSQQIEGHSIEHLARVSEDVVKKKTADSKVMDADAERRIPKFDLAGRFVACGSLCLALSLRG